MASRRLRRHPAFERDLAELILADPTLEERVRLLEWVLERRPELGMSVPGLSSEHALRPAHGATISVSVLYRYTDSEVECLAVRRVPRGVYE
jgi:hypothetical protein